MANHQDNKNTPKEDRTIDIDIELSFEVIENCIDCGDEYPISSMTYLDLFETDEYNYFCQNCLDDEN